MTVVASADRDIVGIVGDGTAPATVLERDTISVVDPGVILGLTSTLAGEVAFDFSEVSAAPSVIEQQVVSVVDEEFRFNVLELSVAGPRGEPGASSLVVERTAGSALGGHRFVIIDTSGNAAYADPTDLTHFHRVVGLTTAAVIAGEPATIRILGEITEPSWNWTVGSPVYLGLAGVPTQVVPPTASFLLVVGFPVNSTTLYVKLREPIQLQ